MLRGMIKKDILNGANVINEVSNIKSRLKEYFIIFFLISASPIWQLFILNRLDFF